MHSRPHDSDGKGLGTGPLGDGRGIDSRFRHRRRRAIQTLLKCGYEVLAPEAYRDGQTVIEVRHLKC